MSPAQPGRIHVTDLKGRCSGGLQTETGIAVLLDRAPKVEDLWLILDTATAASNPAAALSCSALLTPAVISACSTILG